MDAIAQGTRVPAELLGRLKDSTSLPHSPALRQRLKADGYLLLRGAVDAKSTMAARSEVFTRLGEVGEIRQPVIEGIETGKSLRRKIVDDLGAFWRDVCHGPALRAVTHGAEMQEQMSKLLDTKARPHDYMFLRPGRVGLSTHLHYDFPFFARGSDQIYTAWLALGEIPVEEGALMIVEDSNRFDDLIERVKQIDYESSSSPTVQVLQDTVDFVRRRGVRLLTTDFHAGDVVVFDMFTMHGTSDNHSAVGRVRLSCDVRWQPASDSVDPRYQGENPPGTTGAGYAELNGAKPLTDSWHTR